MQTVWKITVTIPNAPLALQRSFLVADDQKDLTLAAIEGYAIKIPGLVVKGFTVEHVMTPGEILREITAEADPASLTTEPARYHREGE